MHNTHTKAFRRSQLKIQVVIFPIFLFAFHLIISYLLLKPRFKRKCLCINSEIRSHWKIHDLQDKIGFNADYSGNN